MQKTKVYQLLQKFNTWELNHLRQFLVSPFFNTRNDVVLLFDFIVDNNNKKENNLSKSNVFVEVFPNANYSNQQKDLLVSYLFKLVEQFLSYREMGKDMSLRKLYLSKAYRQKKEVKSFQKALNDGKKILEKNKLRDTKYLRQRYNFEFEDYDFIGSKTHGEENNLQQLADTFDVMYFAEKLKQFCFQISHQRVFNKNYSIGLQEAILNLLDQHHELSQHPALHIYYLCYQAATTDDEKYFKQLRSAIITHSEKFTLNELRDINLAAINFCIRKMNTGKVEYIREAFELFRLGLEKELLIDNGELSRLTFHNTAMIGIKLKEYKWVENFIQNYKGKLPLRIRPNFYKYQLATLYYEQKKYKEAMQLLATFTSSDDLMILGAKFLLLKIYYETKEVDALSSLIETIRIFLHRKTKLGDYHKKHHQQVIQLTKLLIRSNGNKKSKITLKEKANNIKVQSVKDWFLEQIEVL